jgi:uncharacterized metal-binding protein
MVDVIGWPAYPRREQKMPLVDPKCAKCPERPCTQGLPKGVPLPKDCPIKHHARLIKKIVPLYRGKDMNNFYLAAALTEKNGYDAKAAREEGRTVPVRPRIREIAAFAEAIGARKIGLAFCSGLSDEAGRAAAILEKHGLDVVSVICSCGAADKTDVGIPADYKIRDPGRFEAACNPLVQAEILNISGTAFNILVGLCVGHDMLFTTHSKAPVTTLIVKDRFTGHNPLVSLYTRYHRDIV